MKVISETRRA